MANVHLKHSNQNPADYTDETGTVHPVEILKFMGDQALIAIVRPNITREQAEKRTVSVERLKQVRRRS